MADDLPDGYRDALVMADFEGRAQQEVADRLGLSLSGAKSRIQRARKMLGDALRACCDVEFGAEGRAVAYRRLETCDDC
jgi:RNA polymerase sigma-70 factor (ECF subfamily)